MSPWWQDVPRIRLSTPRMLLLTMVLMCGVVPARCAQGPWVEFRHPESGASVTLVGTSHNPLYAPFALYAQLIMPFRRADVVFFETYGGYLSPHRLPEYQSSKVEFVRAEDLQGFARMCAEASRLATPQDSRTTAAAAPAVLRAIALGVAPKHKRSVPPNSVDISDKALFVESLMLRKSIQEAESTEDVIRFAAAFDKKQVTDAIESVCRSLPSKDMPAIVESHGNELVSLIQSGDWDGVYWSHRKYQLEARHLPEAVFDRLVDFRNEQMLSRVFQGRAYRRIVLVVGAAHMGGPHGLIALLKARGFVAAED